MELSRKTTKAMGINRSDLYTICFPTKIFFFYLPVDVLFGGTKVISAATALQCTGTVVVATALKFSGWEIQRVHLSFMSRCIVLFFCTLHPGVHSKVNASDL